MEITTKAPQLTGCGALHVLLERFKYRNIRISGRTYRGAYELRTDSRLTERLPKALEKSGWKAGKYALTGGPRPDADNNTYWPVEFNFTHEQYGAIRINGIILHLKTDNIFKPEIIRDYSQTVIFRPKKQKS